MPETATAQATRPQSLAFLRIPLRPVRNSDVRFRSQALRWKSALGTPHRLPNVVNGRKSDNRTGSIQHRSVTALLTQTRTLIAEPRQAWKAGSPESAPGQAVMPAKADNHDFLAPARVKTWVAASAAMTVGQRQWFSIRACWYYADVRVGGTHPITPETTAPPPQTPAPTAHRFVSEPPG